MNFEDWKMSPSTCSDLPIAIFNDPNASCLAYEAWHARDAEVSKLESEKAELLVALKRLHDDTKDYIEINHLGDPYNNRAMRDARTAIQHAEKEP